jgi:hypothetical protein
MSSHPYIPAQLVKFIRENPRVLLSQAEQQAIGQKARPEDLAQLMNCHLEAVPALVTNLGPWLGATSRLNGKPRTVVTGICQGKNSAEKAAWSAYGPSVEVAHSVALAAAVADAYDATLQIWIVDGEYANTASEYPELDPQKELDLGMHVQRHFEEKYPSAAVIRTSDNASRGKLYAAATSVRFAKRFPRSVCTPYGDKTPSLWSQIGFIVDIAFMMLEADSHPVLGVFDHDQWRAAQSATQMADGRYAALLFWPVPQLRWQWDSPATSDPVRLTSMIKKTPRRMFSSESLSQKLFTSDTDSSIRERWPTGTSMDDHCPAIAEIAWHLAGDSSCGSDEPDLASRLALIVKTMRERFYGRK